MKTAMSSPFLSVPASRRWRFKSVSKEDIKKARL